MKIGLRSFTFFVTVEGKGRLETEQTNWISVSFNQFQLVLVLVSRRKPIETACTPTWIHTTSIGELVAEVEPLALYEHFEALHGPVERIQHKLG